MSLHIIIFIYFRKFLQGVKKYTKKEKQVYQQKLKNQAKKEDQKEKNKVVCKYILIFFSYKNFRIHNSLKTE